jgi:hypothetical protein
MQWMLGYIILSIAAWRILALDFVGWLVGWYVNVRAATVKA